MHAYIEALTRMRTLWIFFFFFFWQSSGFSPKKLPWLPAQSLPLALTPDLVLFTVLFSDEL